MRRKIVIEALAARTQMSPEELFLDKERVEDLERAIETELSSFEKQVLDLYLTGMSYTQIARCWKRRKVYGQCLTASEEQNPETGVMQNNERREHILEKIFQECVFYSFLIESAELEY